MQVRLSKTITRVIKRCAKSNGRSVPKELDNALARYYATDLLQMDREREFNRLSRAKK